MYILSSSEDENKVVVIEVMKPQLDGHKIPSLVFKHILVDPNAASMKKAQSLTDIVAISGKNQIFVTQAGQATESNMKKVLWQNASSREE